MTRPTGRVRSLASGLRRAVYDRGTWEGDHTGLLLFLLAFGLLVHKTLLPEPFVAPWPILSPVLAVLVLWLPRSRPLGVAFSAVMVVEIAWFWPDVVNHAVFVAFMGAAVVGVWLTGARGGEDGRTTLEAALFPLLRAGVYALFAFAVLHKLNHGFLDPVGSCAVEHYLQLRQRLGFLPGAEWTGARYGLIGATLLSEIAIPVLLWAPRTRAAGLLLAFAFHLVMGVNGHHTFSAFAPAMYVPFLPASAHEWLISEGRRTAVLWHRGSRGLLAGLGTAIAALVLVGGATARPYLALELGWVGFYLTVIVVAGAGILTLDRWRGARPAPGGHAPPLLATVLLGSLALNGMSPYLGLKTEVAFSMFSNLRTEGDGWNHLFVPPSLRWAAFQDTLVQVEWVSPGAGELARLSARRDGFVPSQARSLLQEACREAEGPISLRYRIGERRGETGDACATRPFGPPDPWWSAKLLSYRPVPSANVCRH